MKTILVLILFLALNSWTMASGVQPKIALALGGGAALGYAHIGVIQVLHENGIEPDLVTGASMGSIVGGYYCAGVPLDSIVLEAEDMNIFKLIDWKIGKRGFFEWKKVRKRLSHRLGGMTMEDLPKQFIAVATDLYTGERVMLQHGDLITAMLASSTIPGLYQPLKVNGHYLIDGGLVDEVPILSAHDAGADVIIAVDVSHPLLEEEITSPIDVIRQSYFILQMHNVDSRATIADVVIRPDLRGLSFQSFSQVRESVDVGRKAAQAAMPEIKAAIAAASQKEKLKGGPRVRTH